MKKQEIQLRIEDAVTKLKETGPLVPSITNNVTINFVANAQLAAGASAAMVYLPDEGEGMALAGSAMYINMGTLQPVYAETLPRTVRALNANNKSWVLDPVGIGIGTLRTDLLKTFRECPPSIVRGNASEIIALANLWGLDTGVEKDGVRGVDSTDSVEASIPAAKALAKFIHGAAAVSGAEDVVTDGDHVAVSRGGSLLLTKITGAGCSLGGVAAAYAAAADPFIAALSAVQLYNFAGKKAAEIANGPGTMEKIFLDCIYAASPADIAGNEFEIL